MFCSKCGKEILDEAVICPNCGCSVQKNENKNTSKSNIYEIVAIIFSVISFVCYFSVNSFTVYYWSKPGTKPSEYYYSYMKMIDQYLPGATLMGSLIFTLIFIIALFGGIFCMKKKKFKTSIGIFSVMTAILIILIPIFNEYSVGTRGVDSWIRASSSLSSALVPIFIGAALISVIIDAQKEKK